MSDICEFDVSEDARMIDNRFALYLNSLSFRNDASRRMNIFPLGTIYWNDELVDESLLQWMPEEIKVHLLLLFEIRRRKWEGAILADKERDFWDETMRQFPKCPIFQRLELSTNDRQALEVIGEEVKSLSEEFEQEANLSPTFSVDMKERQASGTSDKSPNLSSTGDRNQCVNNSLMIIYPYKQDGIWMFDDESKGLFREPFVSGADLIIDQAVSEIPNANTGFALIFSANPFPGHQLSLEWERDEYGGQWYFSEVLDMRGWLCPALFKYFDSPPMRLYACFRAHEESEQ